MTEQEKTKIENRLQKYSEIQAKIDRIQKFICALKTGNEIYFLGDFLPIVKNSKVADAIKKILEDYVEDLKAQVEEI